MEKSRVLEREVEQRKKVEGALRSSEAALRESHGEIQNLAGQLIAAQELERRRISRELHDDLNQKIATLAIGLSKAKQALPSTQDVARGQLSDLLERTVGLSDEVRRLSHDLHPGVMEHVGLVKSLESFCNVFSKSSGISIHLSLSEIQRTIPADVALCLYRIVQESLRNVQKHSGAKTARVELRKLDDEIQVSIGDDGTGFDLEKVRGRGRLGLVSMEERVRLLKGTFQIRSRPGSGTEVEARVPLSAIESN